MHRRAARVLLAHALRSRSHNAAAATATLAACSSHVAAAQLLPRQQQQQQQRGFTHAAGAPLLLLPSCLQAQRQQAAVSMMPRCGSTIRAFSISTASSSSSSADSSTEGSSGSNPSSLQASMDKLVDTAVGLVEEGRLQQAVEVLQQGITLLSSAYPGSPELSELHNQAALLLLFGGQHASAASHASEALEATQKHFGPTHPLTGHRLLRLGTIRFAAGQLPEARPLLATAADMLSHQQGDPSLAEALFYANLYSLAAADGPSAVSNAGPSLQDNLKYLVTSLGPDSMIVRLALAAHSKLVGAALDLGLPQGEAAFKQHISLQEIQDPNSAELGLTLYQLAATYYAHDLLTDAGPTLQRATALLRGHYPEEHDLVVLCKHRLGMICAAGRDHRAATSLLTETKQHYAAQQPDHPLALEADVGLRLAQLKALDPRMPSAERAEAVGAGLQEMREHITGMAKALGTEHLLVTAASRYLAQLAVMHR